MPGCRERGTDSCQGGRARQLAVFCGKFGLIMHLAVLPAALAETAAPGSARSASVAGQPGADGSSADSYVSLGTSLEKAENLARQHRYLDVIDTLEPFLDDEPADHIPNQALRYALLAELGRASFHLGRYSDAYDLSRRAVALQPRRVESALYLQASAFLTGRRDQAMHIFREVVRSGAPDLYLAVTLPGERRFLADAEAWSIVEQHAQPLSVKLTERVFEGVRLGMKRGVVESSLGVRSPDPTSVTLMARAGPRPIWAFRFSAEHELIEVSLHAENLLRYTPYRLRLDNDLGWQAEPGQIMAVLGPADATSSTSDGVQLSWRRSGQILDVIFGRPTGPVPPGLDHEQLLLQMVRFRSIDPAGDE